MTTSNNNYIYSTYNFNPPSYFQYPQKENLDDNNIQENPSQQSIRSSSQLTDPNETNNLQNSFQTFEQDIFFRLNLCCINTFAYYPSPISGISYFSFISQKRKIIKWAISPISENNLQIIFNDNSYKETSIENFRNYLKNYSFIDIFETEEKRMQTLMNDLFSLKWFDNSCSDFNYFKKRISTRDPGTFIFISPEKKNILFPAELIYVDKLHNIGFKTIQVNLNGLLQIDDNLFKSLNGIFQHFHLTKSLLEIEAKEMKQTEEMREEYEKTTNNKSPEIVILNGRAVLKPKPIRLSLNSQKT